MLPDPETRGTDLAVGEADPLLASLERRVQCLEAAVAALQEKSAHEATMPQVKAGPLPPEERVRAGDPQDTPRAPLPQAGPGLRPPWLLLDLFGETKAMVRMFFDRHYHVAWTTRIVAILFLPLILTSDFWFPLAYVPILGGYFDKIFDFILTFLVYKVLSREARRYRDHVGGLR